jgi:hypothetical protein
MEGVAVMPALAGPSSAAAAAATLLMAYEDGSLHAFAYAGGAAAEGAERDCGGGVMVEAGVGGGGLDTPGVQAAMALSALVDRLCPAAAASGGRRSVVRIVRPQEGVEDDRMAIDELPPAAPQSPRSRLRHLRAALVGDGSGGQQQACWPSIVGIQRLMRLDDGEVQFVGLGGGEAHYDVLQTSAEDVITALEREVARRTAPPPPPPSSDGEGSVSSIPASPPAPAITFQSVNVQAPAGQRLTLGIAVDVSSSGLILCFFCRCDLN